ncbi:helix-turn-helix domain-containing protein [Afifella marina]|uniref:Helix-turn-helix domain-containing protein n=1 Tax=Afifella marina DSM 2698 TaxID=1120955 RepID=A0A1G5NBU7_AFIMA|nr:helix-turn-helix domain-containing protein [Afifella marina]MBK1623102.1 transcriptional regulator [Afifella marina DSM 2698]MBK1626096.1 transcriptional regulator [Afifella marina]MBK5916974.1 transcriptional regulator [Afifella marina]RAI21977.1 transcriptional regulator [Afifella marina DSM 2698]SCZ34090.1 Helix-turn-helix domain-containing protein [Afifella marina DSM 2698]
MPENTGNIAPLAWQRYVEEALRRRKAEGLTQKDHSALAGVSHPTMAAFERGETTLTLAKALDILRVVGLVDEPAERDTQARFVRDAFERWRNLVAPLPDDSPARFPNGWYRFDYWLEGDFKTPELAAFERILGKAVVRKTGWPPFWLPTREAIQPHEVDGLIECWLAPQGEEVERGFNDPAHCDFWRGAPSGRMFLIRGYQEDGEETFPAGTILDTTLPLWRMGEVLLHAEKLASLLHRDADAAVTIHFRAMFTGLRGRVLRSWANPLSDLLLEGYAARSDEAVLEAKFPADGVESRLAEFLLPLLTSLYDRFGVAGLSLNRVEAEVQRLLNSAINKERRQRR